MRAEQIYAKPICHVDKKKHLGRTLGSLYDIFCDQGNLRHERLINLK